MRYQLTRYPDGWTRPAPTLEDAQQFAQGAAAGSLRWQDGGDATWEATDPETLETYLIELELSLT